MKSKLIARQNDINWHRAGVFTATLERILPHIQHTIKVL